jgi:VCBS repeat protein
VTSHKDSSGHDGFGILRHFDLYGYHFFFASYHLWFAHRLRYCGGIVEKLPPSSSTFLFSAMSVVLALDACDNNHSAVIPPFTLTSSVAAGDLNGDRSPDLASTNIFIADPPPHPGQVSIIVQSQSSPGAFGGPMKLDIGNDPQKVIMGDLNGDTFIDLVSANDTSATISILFQNSSSPGTFLKAQNIAVGAHPTGIAIGDLDGDGHLDIAVADSRLSILFQNTTVAGTFLPPISPGVNCSSVGIGDLNADGRPDLVATGPAAGNVSILLQSPEVLGTFLPPQTVAAGFQPFDVAIADLNADGFLDLAIANLGSPGDATTASLSVLLNDSAFPGRFLIATNYATGARSQSISVGDLNGDRTPDVVVANAGSLGNTGSVSVLLQDPGRPGTFQTAVNRPGTSQPLGVAIADLNGDSLPDIALADDGVRILFQIPGQPGNFQLPILVGS